MRPGRLRLRRLTPAALVAALLLAATAGGQVLDWPREAPPPPLPAKEVDFPPYEIRTLANGLQVVTVLHHEQPVVSLRLLVRAGSAYDPPGKAGLASLVSSLLDQGTTTRTAEEIADTIDSIGGGLGSGAGSDVTFTSVLVMKDGFDFGLDLLSDVVRNPAFRREELDRQREQIFSGLKDAYEDPDYVAGLVFDRLVYGFHPYGMPSTGTPESLQSITPADLHAFHRTYFAPNNAILAVVGDVTTEQAFKGAERVFGSWERRQVPDPAATEEPPPPARRVIVVNKPDAVQTEVRVGHLGIPRKHEDFLALDLAVKILGGEGGNRLQRVLRSERGLTYGASAEMQALKRAGDIMADTDTRSEATTEVLRTIVDEFSRLRRERVHPRELRDAQAYLAGSFPLSIETPSAIAAQVLNALFYELPLAEIETYRERINAVSPDDIQRVARQYLKPDRLSVVLVGNAAVFTPRLEGIGFGEFEVVELSELDLTAVDFRRSAPTGTAPVEPALRAPLAGSPFFKPLR
ncbi:MAG TPA: pitrilysin family protein [Vicinamibacterales bacterium]|nr:pitrilysin family protein [Vicinamibacterales bacterium]